MTSQKFSAINSTSLKGKRNCLQVGSRVVILQHRHLKCSKHGFVQYIDGGYNYVRPESVPVSEGNACERTFELYPNELRVVANYEHSELAVGSVVRIKELDWGTAKAKTHGIIAGIEAERILVQPIGAKRGAIVSVLPENLQLEANELDLSPADLASQVAICVLLREIGAMPLSKLRALLATQAGMAVHCDRQLARLANAGEIKLSESRASLLKPQLGKNKDGAAKITAAIASLSQAEIALAEAVRLLILQS